MIRRYLEPGIEPSLEEVLNDPIVQAVMRRDGVSPVDLDYMIADWRRPQGLEEGKAAPLLAPGLRPAASSLVAGARGGRPKRQGRLDGQNGGEDQNGDDGQQGDGSRRSAKASSA